MLSCFEEGYFSDGRAQAFIKYYKGYKYAFMGILPNEGVSVSEYINGLDGESWYKLWKSGMYADIDVLIPEFSCDCDKELSGGLKAMGMDIPFDPKRADLSNMVENDSGDPLYISRILHKTHINVDRTGSEAAAATAVEMKVQAAERSKREQKEIYLDRPFIYAIVDTETGFPVFLGAVNTVAP